MTAFATATALAAGLGLRSILLAAAVMSGQLSVGWSNDALDADRDAAAGRRDKPVATGEVSRRATWTAAAGAAALAVPLSFGLGWRAGAAHLIAVALAWIYNVQLKFGVASALPYAGAFGLLPVVVAAALAGAPWPRPALVAAAACCGIAAHFANTVGDTADDARTGVRGLPQRVGPSASVVIAAVFVAVAGVLLIVAVGATPATVVAVVVDGLGALTAPILVTTSRQRHAAFGMVIVAVAVLVVAFVVSGGSRLTT